jgi:hypothetical protein
MEPGQADEVSRQWPHAAARVVLLPLFDPEARGFDRFHLADPFGHGIDAFDRCYRRIDRAIESLMADARPAALPASPDPGSPT